MDFAEPVEMTFLQVSREDKVIIEQLGVSQDVTAEFTPSGEKLRTFISSSKKLTLPGVKERLRGRLRGLRPQSQVRTQFQPSKAADL